MAKKISSQDLFTSEDIFKGIRESANKTMKQLDEMTSKLRKSAGEIQKTMGSIKFGNTAQIKQLMDLMQKVTKLQKEAQAIEQMRKVTLSAQAKAEMELLTVEKARNQARQEALKTAKMEAQESARLQKEKEKEAKATANQKNAYKQLEANTRELKNRSKELGAQLLQLEAVGKKNSAEYQRLSTTYRQVTTAAQQGDAQLKKLDKTVGDNFRNVGNYTSAVSNLGSTLATAFGVTLGLAGAVNLFKELTNTFMGFEFASATVAGVLRKTTDETIALQEQAKYLGATTAMTATEVVQLQEAYARLGFSMGQIKDMTKATIDGSIAMNSNLGETAELVGAVVRTFSAFESVDASEIVDKMTASTQMSALSFSKLQTAIPIVSGAAESAGVSFDRLLAILGKLSDAGIDASSSATALRNIFIDSAGQGLDYNEIIQKIGNSTNKLSAGYDEFGKRGAVQSNIIAANLDQIKDLEIGISAAAGTAERAANNQLNTLQGRLTLLGSAWEGFVLSIEDGNGRIGSSMMKTVDTVAELLNIWADVNASENKVRKDTEAMIQTQEQQAQLQLRATREQYEANMQTARSEFERNNLTEKFVEQRDLIISQQVKLGEDAKIAEKDRLVAMKRAEAINEVLKYLGQLLRMYVVYKVSAMAVNLWNTRIVASFTNVSFAMKRTLVATRTMSTGMRMASIGVKGLALSFKSLKAAFMTNPFGLVVVGLTELYFWLSKNTEKTKEQEEAELEAAAAADKLKREKEEETQAIAESTKNFVMLIKQVGLANNMSSERHKLIGQINQQYGTTLKNMADENLMQQQLNAVVHEYIEYQKLKYKIQRNEKKVEDTLDKQLSLEEKIDKKRTEMAIIRAKLGATQFGETAKEFRERNGLIVESGELEDEYIQKQSDRTSQLRDAQAKQRNTFSEVDLQKWEDLEAELRGLTNQNEGLNDELTKLTQSNIDTQNSLSKYKFKDPTIGGANGSAGGGANSPTKQRLIELREIKTELRLIEEYLDQQEELLWQIDEAMQKTGIEAVDRAYKQEWDLQKKNLEKTGNFEVYKLNELIDEKAKLETKYLKDKEAFEIAQLEKKYDREMKERARTLALEKEGVLKTAEDTYLDNLKTAEDNAAKKTEAYEKYKKAVDEINAKYDDRVKDLDDQENVRYKDVQTEKVVVSEETAREIARVNRDKNEAIKSQEEELAEDLKKIEDNKEKEALDKLKEREKAKQDFAKMTADYLIRQSERVVEQLDREITAAEQQADTLRKLVEEGNINAEQSLSEQQRLIVEATKKKEQELKRQQQIRLAETVYTTYAQKVETGSKNPLAETIRDTTLLQAFINSLPTYEKGTEDTGRDSYGVDGKGGMLSVLHPHERVVPKTLNDKIGNMSNEQLTKIAQEYNQRRIMGYREQESSLDFAILVTEIKSLKKAIVDKPVSNVELGEITQSAMEIVHSTRKGNSVVYNRFKVRK